MRICAPLLGGMILVLYACGKASSCTLQSGEGRGDAELFQKRNVWNTRKRAQGCVDRCLFLRTTSNSRINGMRSRNGNWCWCIIRMGTINRRKSGESCFFEKLKPQVLPGCELKAKRKAGWSSRQKEQIGMNHKGVRACVLRCNRKRQLDPAYNGMEYSFNKCYCLRNVRTLRRASYWQKACFLTTPVARVKPAGNETCTLHAGFGEPWAMSFFTVKPGSDQIQACIDLCATEKMVDPAVNAMTSYPFNAEKPRRSNNCLCWRKMERIVHSNRHRSYAHMRSCFLGDNAEKLPSGKYKRKLQRL